MRSVIFLLLLPFSAAAQLAPTLIATLPGEISETSGWLRVNGDHWTHEDSGNEAVLFQIDPVNGNVIRTLQVNAPNVDWEDITADDQYVYIGDVGNNSGDRTDLRILRFPIAMLNDTSITQVEVETINFSYEDQTVFEPAENANDWDCEAIIARDDSIFVFTKNWLDQQTRVYAFPSTPGDHIAQLRASYDVQGMITGAALDQAGDRLALIGYTNGLFVPFVVLAYGFEGNAFFSGIVQRDPLSLAFVQMEAVEWDGPNSIHLTNEASPFSEPRFWELELPTVPINEFDEGSHTRLFPNPARNTLHFRSESPADLVLIDTLGRTVFSGRFVDGDAIDITHLSAGNYIAEFNDNGRISRSILVIER